jgi:hypothetical protein
MRHRRWWTVVAVATVLGATGCYQDFDFDADHKADHVVWDSNHWLDLETGDILQWHTEPADHGAVPVPGDWDGDHLADLAILRTNGEWVTGTDVGTISFPAPPELANFVGSYMLMLPVPADYDGDGDVEPAWYRESDATWFILGQAPIQFGSGPTSDDIPPNSIEEFDQDHPVPADYDGDGIDDLAVYGPVTKSWRVRSSATGTVTTTEVPNEPFLVFPAPADYDHVGHAQLALFGPDGWWIEGRADLDPYGADPLQVRVRLPAVADYDGDGHDDLSYIAEPFSLVWHTQGSPDTYETDDALPVPTGTTLDTATGHLWLTAEHVELNPPG